MMFWCYDDKQSSWGKMLYMDALRTGHEAEFFKGSRHITEPGYLFARMEQRNVEAQRKDLLVALDIPGIVGLTNREDILEYEDKLYQTEKYGGPEGWMPKTFIIRSLRDAHAAVGELGYPFVSKSRTGSGSASVRFHDSEKAALDEAGLVFGRGLHTDREVQKDYLIWQKFLGDNDYAYRVTRVGNWYWMIRIHMRPDIALASGSGKMEVVIPETHEELDAFSAALKFFERSGSKWSGIDLLYDHDLQEWKVLETTLAWNLHNRGGNTDCPVFDKDVTRPEPEWIGAHQFLILLHEVEQGVFDG